MKFTVQMKDPDTLDGAITDAVERSFEESGLIGDEELDAAKEARREKWQKLCSRWFRYGEYLAVEIDTDAQTCTVLSKGNGEGK